MVLVTLLAVAFVAVALAKPWATGPTGPVGSASPGAAPFASADLVPRAGAISLSLPPATTAVWTAIRWRQLAPDEPLNLVRSIVAWRGGFAALGFDATDAAAPTPLWTSADGAQWSPVPAGAATSIAPAVQVVAIAAVPDGLVALTSPGARCDGYELCGWFGPPVTAWTSADGVRWARRPVPALGTAVTWRGAALAGGPAGLVAVSLGTHAEVKRSPDGVTWITSPVDSLPTDVAVGTVQATPTGYVVAGTTAPRGAGAGPGTLWSADGRDWRVGSTVPGGGPDGSVIDGPALRTLAAGRDRPGRPGGVGRRPDGRALVAQHGRAVVAVDPRVPRRRPDVGRVHDRLRGVGGHRRRRRPDRRRPRRTGRRDLGVHRRVELERAPGRGDASGRPAQPNCPPARRDPRQQRLDGLVRDRLDRLTREGAGRALRPSAPRR